ncbi:PAS domain-containing protein [Roseomonas sp. KE2513]|uniref:histidine kinase famiy protein n=1 Tax=Roseomonas sp. KE2513 TaxID=2479202 RepID=UPI0018DF6256|nr:histidine kinase famiy protein [Roseomonas sp. KE2513]MBI0536368.1 PAS domain-containing protein [Roseomonas sp. KE2513]
MRVREDDLSGADETGRPDATDVQGQGDQQSRGVPAAGEHDPGSYSPTGNVAIHHWQEATVTEPGLDDRGDVFFAAVEMTRMPMILTDPNLPDNPIVFANRAFQDLTGYRQEEIVGRNCRFLQGAQTDREKVAELRTAIHEHRAASVELLNYKRDGTPFWNGVFIAPVFEKDGRLLYFFASQLDVTRRRTSEQAYRQAQKMEAIGQLTAGLAHDFNNLLLIVSGNLEFLRGKIADKALLRYVDRASDATERGAKLTRQLLAFARKTRLEPRPIDLSSLINDFGEMLETTVGSRADLHFSLRRRLPSVMIDPVHLEMALLNVVINARDAMPEGGTVTVETSAVTRETDGVGGGRYVALSIRDEGTGMPAYVVERATEPFFTTKGPSKGTGLGLAMVQGFVQQSLGRLEIESEPGQGTTIRMLFPASEMAAEPVGPHPDAVAEPAPKEKQRGSAETILVVEDNDDVLALAREHLLMLGYRVLVARGPEEALEILDGAEGASVDLLFSDILMPGGMNGIVLAERAREQRPGIGVLLTTGYNEDLVLEGPRAPSMDVLGKPYRRADLADRVRAALNRRSAGEQPVQKPREHEGPRHEG